MRGIRENDPEMATAVRQMIKKEQKNEGNWTGELKRSLTKLYTKSEI